MEAWPVIEAQLPRHKYSYASGTRLRSYEQVDLLEAYQAKAVEHQLLAAPHVSWVVSVARSR